MRLRLPQFLRAFFIPRQPRLRDRLSWMDEQHYPVGWDEGEQRAHDVSVTPGGPLLHHSTCWCWKLPHTLPDLMAGRNAPLYEAEHKHPKKESSVLPQKFYRDEFGSNY